MKFPSSRSLTSLGGVVAFVLIAGILVFMARSQDVRALLASWNGLNADQISIYNQLVKLQSAGELNYDEVSFSLFESAKHQQNYRAELKRLYPYISEDYDVALEQDFRRFELSVEDFKSQLALTRNSTRFLIQRKTEVLSQTNLSDVGKHKLELDIINFALKPTPFNSGAIDRALIQISATYVGDPTLLEAFTQHKQKVLEGYSDTLALVDQIDGLISVSTFHTVAQKLESELALYSRSVNGFAVSLIALILALLVRVVMLSRRAENAVKELSSLNEELDERVQVATKELEERVEQLNVEKLRAEDATRAKSEFLANMSHEIRTPLNGISGMAQILKRTELTNDQRSHIETILTSTGSLSQVINDILDFSKIEAGKIEIEKLDFSLLELVESIVDQVTLLANKSENQLVIHYSSLLPEYVNSDASRIRQIMLNLLSNANKFTHNGSIEVRCELLERGNNQFFKLSVKDSGIGIAEDKLAHIFEAFSQEDASTTRRFGGTGLGLTICKRLSQLMGGDISVSSEQGDGSCFSFYLPLVAAEAPANAKRSGPLRHIKPMIFDKNDIRRRAMLNHLDSWNLAYVVLDDISDFILAIQQLDDEKNIHYDVTCLIVNMDEYQLAISDALKGLQRDIPKLYLTPLYSEDFGEFDRSVFTAEVRSPIKPSEFLDALADGHEGVLNEEFDSEEKTYDFSGRRVLLVDDNAINRTVAELMLDTVGVEVIMAEDGKQAVDTLHEKSIDLVFMDCQMPVMDGYEASRTIRQLSNPLKRDVPIVAMTANAMKGDKEMCLEAGMDDYISKPVEAQLLYELMSKWLDHTHSEGIAARD